MIEEVTTHWERSHKPPASEETCSHCHLRPAAHLQIHLLKGTMLNSAHRLVAKMHVRTSRLCFCVWVRMVEEDAS